MALGWVPEADTAIAPFLEDGRNVIRQKHQVGGAANRAVRFRIRAGRRQSEKRVAVRRRDRQPAVAARADRIKGKLETELLPIETQTSIRITDKNRSGAEA